MSAIRVLIVGLISFGLIACGSSAPPRKVKKKKKTTTETVAAPKSEGSTTSSDKKDTEKPTDTVKKAVSSVAKEATAKKTPPKPEVKTPVKTVAKPAVIPTPTFPNIPLSGRSYGEWYRDLCGNDPAKIKDACDAFQLAGSHAKGAAPKLQQLTKHANADVAKAAKEALAAVNK